MNPMFLERMEKLIPDEMPAFMEALDRPLYRGVRISKAKKNPSLIEKNLTFPHEPSPFASDSFYVDRPLGLHPYHIAGELYMQEPSASAAVTVLNPQASDTVLDLCAAPGSKSTQIADRIRDGFLVSNEIDPDRAAILLSNLERMGAENFMVTNMDSKTLCSQFPETFDKVLVDAPCSGEGMIKKHEKASEGWSLDNIKLCQARQKEILPWAVSALKGGGEMVYSTCTYAPEENEEIVAWLLETYPELEQIDPNVSFGRKGVPTEGMDASRVVRIFPMDGGEGHFIAKFRKKEGSHQQMNMKKDAKLPKEAAAFFQEAQIPPYAHIQLIQGKDAVQVYGMNHPFPDLKKGRILRQGVRLGDIKKGRFEPAHALCLAASMQGSLPSIDLSIEEMDEVMHGNALNKASKSGWTAFSYDGIPFAWGKSTGTRINNKLPKGLRLKPQSHVRTD